MAETPYPKKTRRLPSILSPEEVAHLIDSVPTQFYRIVLMTLYGTGARRAELTRLQIPDVDSRRMVIHIRDGKGRQDRDVMLSYKDGRFVCRDCAHTVRPGFPEYMCSCRQCLSLFGKPTSRLSVSD